MIRSKTTRLGRRGALALAALGLAAPTPGRTAEGMPTPYTVTRDFDGETKGDGAYDLSGMACRPTDADGSRLCVVVNDENRGAQFARLAGTTLTPGATAYDLGTAPSPAIRGTPPAQSRCSGGPGRFDQLDGEAVAYAEPFFYVTGSHGCTRGKRRYKLSSMILTRLRPNADGTAAAETVSTYRLFDALMASAPVRDSVLRDLEFDWNALPPEGTPQPNGLNVEGLAVVGGRLYAGLRAPSLAGKAFLVSVPVEALFADGNAALSAEIGTIPLEAGPDAGVRDLTILPDGRMLVLTGSSRNGLPVPFRLSLVDLPSGALTPVATLAPVRGENEKGKVIDGKAEAVVPLGSGRVLVLFDSLRNGAPHAYAVPIPERGAPTPP
ncbi:DUF3616 domain-containing protein [Methylobacterium sp. Leaf88]|uniref:DUF3616 domain-containing protein n=1 Tax=Methylobacterium sp. Leaf88 TaxID=1736244 RepID=UPI0006FDA8E2|nr:DUF3616 domain-containing protein [Methylobacterium sp. Leaf88]KQO70075.1 hypothetical protein ASF20_20185 [Methylobacterium sp. Leaf88]